MTFAEMERRLKNVDVQDISMLSIENTRGDMIIEQRMQMKDGFLKTGSSIRPPYAASTVRRKIKKGQMTWNVTLEDTHEFKDAFFVDVRPGSYVIDSAKMVGGGVLLSPYLEKMYGPSIWGLGGDYKARYIKLLHQAMQQNLNEKIFV